MTSIENGACQWEATYAPAPCQQTREQDSASRQTVARTLESERKLRKITARKRIIESKEHTVPHHGSWRYHFDKARALQQQANQGRCSYFCTQNGIRCRDRHFA